VSSPSVRARPTDPAWKRYALPGAPLYRGRPGWAEQLPPPATDDGDPLLLHGTAGPRSCGKTPCLRHDRRPPRSAPWPGFVSRWGAPCARARDSGVLSMVRYFALSDRSAPKAATDLIAADEERFARMAHGLDESIAELAERVDTERIRSASSRTCSRCRRTCAGARRGSPPTRSRCSSGTPREPGRPPTCRSSTPRASGSANRTLLDAGGGGRLRSGPNGSGWPSSSMS
jgi:hypothetical protein